MRKIYVKKESLYLKPFYKQKCFFFLLLLMGVIFLFYQFFYLNQLQNKIDTNLEFKKIVGVNPSEESSRLVEVPITKNLIRLVWKNLIKYA